MFFFKTDLVSISGCEIRRMTEEEVLARMKEATHSKVFTDRTWSKLNDRVDYLR